MIIPEGSIWVENTPRLNRLDAPWEKIVIKDGDVTFSDSEYGYVLCLTLDGREHFVSKHTLINNWRMIDV